MRSRPRFRRWIRIAAIAAIVLLIAASALLILLFLAFRDFSLPPLQDCNGTSIHISGTVQGISGAQVTVKGDDNLYPGSHGIDFTTTTDANGKFDSGSADLQAFVCELLTVTISAAGFQTQQVSYILLNHFSDASLSASMTKEQPVPVVLDVELRASR